MLRSTHKRNASTYTYRSKAHKKKRSLVPAPNQHMVYPMRSNDLGSRFYKQIQWMSVELQRLDDDE